MTFDPAHHIYNIQLAENAFQWNLCISKFSSAAPIKGGIGTTNLPQRIIGQ